MVNPPVCDVCSSRLQDLNHAGGGVGGGGGSPFLRRGLEKIYCMQFLSYDMSSSSPQKLSSSLSSSA